MVVVIFDFIWGSRKGAELLLSDPTRHCGLEPQSMNKHMVSTVHWKWIPDRVRDDRFRMSPEQPARHRLRHLNPIDPRR